MVREELTSPVGISWDVLRIVWIKKIVEILCKDCFTVFDSFIFSLSILNFYIQALYYIVYNLSRNY